MAPAIDPTVHQQIMDQIMVANLKDNTNSWDLLENGDYQRVEPGPGDPVFSAHAYFMNNPSLSGRGRALSMDSPSDLVGKNKTNSVPQQKSVP